jgi:hypothetical protein
VSQASWTCFSATVDGRYLIVEVKVKASELDEGIGQLGRHRRLFAEMNHLEPGCIRRLLACPDIPKARFPELREAGIEWLIVPPEVDITFLRRSSRSRCAPPFLSSPTSNAPLDGALYRRARWVRGKFSVFLPPGLKPVRPGR